MLDCACNKAGRGISNHLTWHTVTATSLSSYLRPNSASSLKIRHDGDEFAKGFGGSGACPARAPAGLLVLCVPARIRGAVLLFQPHSRGSQGSNPRFAPAGPNWGCACQQGGGLVAEASMHAGRPVCFGPRKVYNISLPVPLVVPLTLHKHRSYGRLSLSAVRGLQ